MAIATIGARFDWTRLDALPLALAGAWLVIVGMRLRLSADVVAGVCFAWVSAAVAGHGTWYTDMHAILPVHLLLVLLLAAGYWFRDGTGSFVRRIAVVMAVVLAANAALSEPPYLSDVPGWARMLYPFMMALLVAVYSRVTGDAWLYTGAAASVAVGGAVHLSRVYVHVQHRVTGLNELAWGALFFLLAAVISVFKAGLRPSWARLKSHWRS